MKKLFMVAIILMVGVGAAMAQKNVKAAGLNLIYGSEISSVGVGAKFQYGITDAIRIEPSFNYFFEKDGFSMWDINANFHYLINVADNFNVYPLTGLGYTKIKSSWDYSYITEEYYDDYYDGEDWEDYEKGSASEGEIVVNIGAGAEYQLNENLAVGAELRYQIIQDCNQLVFGLGVTYKF